MDSPVRLGVSPATATPTDFTGRGFEALFPHTGTLGCTVCLTPQLFLLVYLHANVGLPRLPAAASLSPPAATLSVPPATASPPWPPVSALPIGLYECFFFNSLVAGLPYSSIFWQFWLLFVFQFVVVLLLVVQGGKVYLPTPPSWLEVLINIIID